MKKWTRHRSIHTSCHVVSPIAWSIWCAGLSISEYYRTINLGNTICRLWVSSSVTSLLKRRRFLIMNFYLFFLRMEAVFRSILFQSHPVIVSYKIGPVTLWRSHDTILKLIYLHHVSTDMYEPPPISTLCFKWLPGNSLWVMCSAIKSVTYTNKIKRRTFKS